VMTTLAHGPDPSSSTTWGLHEPPPQPMPAALEYPQLLLRGRRLLREKHLSTFTVATRLRPWSATSTSGSHGPGHIRSHTSLTLLS
jgi:hypothetical protein